LILAMGGLASGAATVDCPRLVGRRLVGVVDGSAGGAARLRALRGRPTALDLNGSAAAGEPEQRRGWVAGGSPASVRTCGPAPATTARSALRLCPSAHRV
jgi:hypothetical protein